jgi:hypothetical protein
MDHCIINDELSFIARWSEVQSTRRVNTGEYMASDRGGRPAGETLHRQETFRYIILPMTGVLALLILGVAAVLLLPKPKQVSIIADWLLTILFLCPAVLCLFPVVILLVAAVAGLNKAHGAARKPLQKLENLSASLNTRTAEITDAINQKTVDASVKIAFADRLLSIFDPPSSTNGEKEE